ncbi:MAG: hypothetical protein A2504_12520 [Bdellovibrionales bacterium RIFOXYD12_FULL_39_22]|nr:MAG: hypothetical protein A2385_00140 [Bdellovibrionales bacterium RIFOXYB1_FULL_39_21]OFZ44065.1 MAG: hypothetical protein A2485_03805 [Bdellovibrionales bacterium RIFOXYC12_FULL_39_17]OFZ48533.1 MAG: hypothetical protein A2404_07265 [Bdellovibrionales bacterium RIFOXYC1_FULL_39_130]OFZ73579.1 MAG: hypothetical protein A2451_06780 [Bdellovibrionales bacterium RIFOXYC2_FULL_39_8]OFZ76721.1 MAG: hypothetical protein A2560_11640 [Bdellovibrionales bacterium RIFOXYD1_FULL_39_84]OFZ94999.1 MAG:
MDEKKIIIDLILPCYNTNELDPSRLISYIQELEAAKAVAIHPIIVFDGPSEDINLDALKEQFSLLPLISFVKYKKNRGKGFAVRSALPSSKGKFHLYTDIDLPYPLEYTGKIIDSLLAGHDLSVGVRQKIVDDNIGTHRRIISLVFRFFAHYILRLPFKDTQCGLKGFNRKGKFFLKHGIIDRYTFDLEFLAKCFLSKKIKSNTIDVTLRKNVIATHFHCKVILQEAIQAFKFLFYHYGIYLFMFLFSWWLMFSSFNFDSLNNVILVGSHAFSDFLAHVPMIRSFSWGENFPIEYPLYSGEPIRYHYLFYLVAGMLERFFLRIDYALNLISLAGFFLLLLMIYKISLWLFRDKKISVLSVLFFLFNGTLSSIEFFSRHGLNINAFKELFTQQMWQCFYPYGGVIGNSCNITAFSNLNIYTNQRHLGPAFGIVLAFLYFSQTSKILSQKRAIIQGLIIGIIISIFPIFHQPSLLFFAILLAFFFLISPGKRLFYFTAGLISLVGILWQIKGGSSTGAAITWHVGYLIEGKVTIMNFINFWWRNLGLPAPLAIAGFIMMPKRGKLLLVPAILLFILGNTFQFASEMSANHKLFNFSLIFFNMAAAYALVRLYNLAGQTIGHRLLLKFTQTSLLAMGLFSIAGGIIDIFPLVNEHFYHIPGLQKRKLVEWFKKNTLPSDAIFNSNYNQHPASLAGRKIFMGWAYFPFSLGYDTLARAQIIKETLNAKNFKLFCEVMNKYKLAYATIEENQNDSNSPFVHLQDYLDLKQPDYLDPETNMAVYSKKSICAP